MSRFSIRFAFRPAPRFAFRLAPRFSPRPAHLLLSAFLLALSLAPAARAQVTQQVIYSFCQQDDCADGSRPTSGMALLSTGSFIVATDGFQDSNSSIVLLTPDGLNDFSPNAITEFCSGSPTACPAGSFPTGTPIEALNTNLFFANEIGGNTTGASDGSGIVWRYSQPYGNSLLETAFFDFCSDTNCAAGATPQAGFIQGTDGALYGTTNAQSLNGSGSVFRLDSSSGSINVLHNFCATGNCADGGNVIAPLLQAADGNFYGTTYGGGNEFGVVFKLTPEGNYTVLHTFCTGGTGCPDGGYPVGALVQADNGNIYGVASAGGSSLDAGTVFYIDTTGAFHTYMLFGCILAGTPCINGYTPNGGLILGSDGNLYGTTTTSSTKLGGSGQGIAFQLPLNGNTATTLVYFCSTGTPCLNGNEASGELIVGSDANLYGVTSAGGSTGGGTAYYLTTSNILQPAVQLTLSASTVAANTPVTLSWKVPYAYSQTAQLCGASVQNFTTGSGSWSGQQTGTYANHAYSGSSVITPTAAGTYTYALTCGGKESGFATLTVTPGKANSTSTLSASPLSVSVGQSVTLKATVKGSGATPTGTVTFSADGAALSTVSLNGSGVASLTASTNGTAPATYPVTATYNGNSSYNSSNSSSVNVTVTKAPTSIALTASPTSVTPPASVTLTATVKRSAASTSGTPTGSVTFSTEGVTLATVKLNASGVAKLTASSSGYPAGAYPIKAVYAGDTYDTTSTSSAVTVTVK